MPALNFSMFVPTEKILSVLFTDDSYPAHLKAIDDTHIGVPECGKATHYAYVDNSGVFILSIPENSSLEAIWMYDEYIEAWVSQDWSQVSPSDESIGMAYYSMDQTENPVVEGYITYKFRDLDGDGEPIPRSYYIAFQIHERSQLTL